MQLVSKIMMMIKTKMIGSGWLAWERFRCNTDCVNDPENCISGTIVLIFIVFIIIMMIIVIISLT